MQGECDIWRSRACGYKKKGRPHEPKVSRKKSEDYRADLFTKFLEPDRHHKLIKRENVRTCESSECMNECRNKEKWEDSSTTSETWMEGSQ